MLESGADIYKGSGILFYNCFHTGHHSRYFIVHHILARVECCASKVSVLVASFTVHELIFLMMNFSFVHLAES